MVFSDSSSPEAAVHTRVITEKLHELTDLRTDVSVIGDLRANALVETTIEVLGGLCAPFLHYEEGTEEARGR